MDELKILASIRFANDWWILLLPCALIALDVVTGLVNAWVKHNFKSFKMREGLGRKFGEVMILVVGELLSVGLQLPPYVMAGFSAYIMLMEVVSIFENLVKLGVPVPKFIRNALDIANDIINGDNELSDESKEIIQDLINKRKEE